jgi:hypothetical protein
MKTTGFEIGALAFVLMDDGDGVTMMVRQGSNVWPLFAFKYESAAELARRLGDFVNETRPAASRSADG